MNRPSFTSGSTPDGLSKWPVLARLSDVSDQLNAVEQRSARAAAAGFVDYRFDPPAGTDDETLVSHRSIQPHAFRRPMRYGSQAYATSGRSSVLPHSNPFSEPGTSLQDKLAPIARFLVLFLLVTAAGTMFQMTNRRTQTSSEAQGSRTRRVPPSTTISHPLLEPATTIVEPPTVKPTASGPLGATLPTKVLEPIAEIQSAVSEPLLAGANGSPLPQVQTTELIAADANLEAAGPPTIARLPGFIQPVSPFQAHHDKNESGLH